MKSNLKNFLRLCCAIIAAFFISLSASAADVFVDQNATGLNNGTTWVDAYIDLQDGLGDADAGETVFVAKGTYKPGVVQAASFDIPLEVHMQGGYAGSNNPLNPFDRDFVLYETILSGDIDNNDLSSPAQEPSHIQGDNSYHVVTIIRENALEPPFEGTEVDGFMITAGNAIHIGVGSNVTGGGGGAFVVDISHPINYPGPFADGPLFRNCIFQGNRADRTGGAIASAEVGLEVRDCQILNNESDGGCIVVQLNWSWTTTEGGGGVSGIAPMIVVNSTFIGNVCTGKTTGVHEVFAFGGGLSAAAHHEDNTIAVANCFFDSNEAQDDPADEGVGGVGGGAAIGAGHVMNCVFINNLAENNLEAGGGLLVGGDVNVRQCTFYGNSAPNGLGGGLVYGGNIGDTRPYNCIFWANTDGDSGGSWNQQAEGYYCPRWSNIQDWECGDCILGDDPCDVTYRNICINPEFVDPANNDLRLTRWSPSIEKGNDGLIPLDWGDVDFDGNNTEILPWDLAKKTRDKNAGFDPGPGFDVDQGAYEFQCPACPWDLNKDNTVSTPDLLILLAQWENRCHAADFVVPEAVGVEDQLAMYEHWGDCNLNCFGGGGGSSSSLVWDPQVVSAVQLIGFNGQADYSNWALNVATNGQAHAATIIIAAIIGE